MLAQSVAEEHLRPSDSRHSSYFDITYISMAFLIALAEKKNMLLNYIKRCEQAINEEMMKSIEWKEKLYWIVMLI